MADRLAWPVALRPDGTFATVVQDDDDDIEQCIAAILAYRPGDLADLPELGIADETFTEQPVELDAAADVVRRHEPRAPVLAQQRESSLGELVADVAVAWGRADGSTDDEEN